MWRLQGGSYIPGFSGQAYGAGLQRDVTKTRKDQARKAEELNKYMSKRQMLQKWGGRGLKALGVPSVVGDIGGYGLSKLFGGKAPEVGAGSDGTGLLGSGYEQLGEAAGGIEKSMLGRLGGSMLSSLSGGVGKKMLGDIGGKFKEQIGDKFGKWKAGRTGLSGYEGTSMGDAFGLDMEGARTPFGGAGNTLLPGFGGFSMPVGYNENSISPRGFQSGGALGKTFGLSKPSFNTYDPDKTKSWMSMVDKLAGDTDARKKALAELGGMEHDESAKESEDIYQKSLGDMDKGNLKSLQQLTKQVKNVARPDTPYYYTDEGLVDMPRQMQSGFMPQQEELEPMMNPFTGESLGELSVEDVPFEYLRDLRQGKSKNPYEDIVSGLEYGTRQPEQSLMDRLLGRGQQQLPKGSGRRLRELMGDENYFAEGMQMGGMMPGGVSNALPYNIGGSVQQQPMAYQLGGLLKYKRSPMMG